MDQDKIIRNLRLQLIVERAIIAVVLLFILGYYAVVHLITAPYAINVNGKPVAFVASRQVAQSVLSQVKRKGPKAEFREKVAIGRGSPKETVVSETKAVEALENAATVIVEAWVIFVDGKSGAALPSEQLASQVLNRAREKFGAMVQNLMEIPTFKEDVTVEPILLDASLIKRDVDSALNQLITSASVQEDNGSSAHEHIVQNGQIAVRIAKEYGLNLNQLEQLNPGRNLDRLQIGDKIVVGKVPSVKPKAASNGKQMNARLTVVVRDSISQTERIPYKTETISSVKLRPGKQILISSGRAGTRRVKRAVTYENGKKTGSEIVEEIIISQPVPKRIAVGINL